MSEGIGTFFCAYGRKLPKIKAVLPISLPTASANELQMYNQ